MMCVQPVVHLRNDANRSIGIGENSSSYLHSTGTCHHHFNGICTAGYAAHTDYRNGNRLCDLPYHTHSNGENRRARHAADVVPQNRAAIFDIDPHAQKGIDEGNAVGTGGFHCLGNIGNAGDIGRKLYDQRLLGCLSHCCGNHFRTLTVHAKRCPALFHVRAGDVQFDHMHIGFVQLFRNGNAFLYGRTGNICQNHSILCQEIRQFPFQKRVDSRILQPYRVQHTAGSFGDTGSRIARTGLSGCTLGGNAAQFRKREQFLVLSAVAKYA